MSEVCTSCVLLVDDDAAIRDLLAMQLEKAGLHVIHAEDGIDALVILRSTLPRVIISDLQMPRMAGHEFIEVVRRRFPSIPVVVLAGSISGEFSSTVRPDCWFEKSMLQSSEFLKIVNYLARNTSDSIDSPQVISVPIRIPPSASGHIVITCPECLRSFEAVSPPENKTGEQTAICTHCEASVPLLIESTNPK